ADAVADLELLDLCWVVGGETADPVGAGVSDPDAILLVNHHGKGSQQMPGILQRIFRLIDKEELHLLGVAPGEIHDLGGVDAGCPDVAVGRDDDLLHFAELATEGPTLGWGKRFAGLVELDDRLAAVGGAPDVVLRVDRQSEADALDAAAGESQGRRRERLAVWRGPGKVSVPEGILFRRAEDQVVPRPDVPLAVDHHLAGRTQPAAGELQRQNPGAGCPAQVRHEWSRP